MDFFSSKPTTASLSIESNPPGADAKLSTGATCKTPCSLTVSLANEFTVALSLTGYGPETRTVKPVAPEGSAKDATATLLDPNPLFVELKQPVPPKAPPTEAQAPDHLGLARARARHPPCRRRRQRRAVASGQPAAMRFC